MPAQHLASRLVALGGGDSIGRDLGGGMPFCVDRPEVGVGHAQRLEDLLSGEHVEPLAASALDEPSQHEETHVGVAESLAWTRHEIDLGNSLPGLVGTLLVVFEGIIGNKARTMAEELLDGDLSFAVIVKLGKQTADSICRAQPALVDQDHDRRGRGNRLGERRQIKDRVAGHRLGCWLEHRRPAART